MVQQAGIGSVYTKFTNCILGNTFSMSGTLGKTRSQLNDLYSYEILNSQELDERFSTLNSMKHFLMILTFVISGCSGNSEPKPESVQLEVPQRITDLEGLAFENLSAEKFEEWEPNILDDYEIAILEEDHDYEPEIVRTGVKRLNAWKGAEDFGNDLDSNDYFVYRALRAQLKCDQLQIRGADPVPGSLRYEAKCRGMWYLVEYDLYTVQIMKVIKE
ncbi:hypothetical protein [uncultured Gimesia sp.]|uniref:hypothetical protein n=1 Tax=uncultured Gimesia sp. TaxID=1678688 RepID=UPI0030D8C02D|tara:strand:+ start:321148 stop:321798 length:651 start_codon:yes stop_codon:yes gene_type:complete